MEKISDIHQPTDVGDKRLNIIRRCYYNGITPYDTIQRIDKANAFPPSYSYFQKKLLIKHELEKIRKEDRERILAAETDDKNEKAEYIARLEWLYVSSVQQGDIPNARLLAKDIAVARGVSIDSSSSESSDGIAAILREVSKMGRAALEKARGEAIDITPMDGEIIDGSTEDKRLTDNLPIPVERKSNAAVVFSPNVQALIQKNRKKKN